MQHCSQCQDAACRLYAAAAMQNPEIRPGSRDYDVCSQLSGEDTRADQSDSATTLTCHVPHTRVTCPSHHNTLALSNQLKLSPSSSVNIWRHPGTSRQPHQAGQYLEIKKWRNVGERCPGVRIWAVFGLLCDVMLITLADRLSRLVCLGNVKKPRLLGCLAVCLAVALLLEIL